MSNGDKEQVIEGGSNSGGSNIILVILVVIALIVAAIALILGIVALSNGNKDIYIGGRDGDGDGNEGDSSAQTGSGEATTSRGDDDRIWQLSFEHTGNNYGYIDDATGELKGFQVDLATAICQIAGKSCELVYDSPRRCWESVPGSRPQGGEGLMNQYYDACVGWVQSYDRPRTFKFSTPYSYPIKTVFMVNNGNTAFQWDNIKSDDVIGFVDGWAYDEHCIAREKDNIMGWDLAVSQIVRYSGRDELLEGLQANEVDAIFDNAGGWIAKTVSDVMVVGPEIESCAKEGLSVMMRKDSQLDSWWNPAFETLKNSAAQWRGICNDLLDEHGHRGGPTPQEYCVDYPAN